MQQLPLDGDRERRGRHGAGEDELGRGVHAAVPELPQRDRPGDEQGDGLGRTAPDMLGDDTTYGAEVKGHNAANPYVDADGRDGQRGGEQGLQRLPRRGVSAPEQRGRDEIHGQPAAGDDQHGGRAEHGDGCVQRVPRGGVGTPASSQESTHGNVNAAFTARSTHTGTRSGSGTRARPATSARHGQRRRVGEHLHDQAGDRGGRGVHDDARGRGATTAAIRFVRMTGTDSFDDGGGSPADNVCVGCHTNAGRPGAARAC